MAHALDGFFNPTSIAVVGASNTLNKIGAAPMSFLLNFGYQGVIVPIHPCDVSVRVVPVDTARAPAMVNQLKLAPHATAGWTRSRSTR